MPALAEHLDQMGAPEAVRQAAAVVAASALGAATGGAAGAAAAMNVDVNNRQLHPDERQWVKEKAKDFAKFYAEKTGRTLSTEQAQNMLLANGYRLVDATASKGPGGDSVAVAYISQNGEGLFHATTAEYSNPFLYGNKDGSLTPEQRVLPGAVANPAAGLSVAAGLASGGVFSAAAPKAIALGQSAAQLGAEAWTAYRAATAAYSMGAAFGTGAAFSGGSYTFGAAIGAALDQKYGSGQAFDTGFNQRFSYMGLTTTMTVGGLTGMYGTAMYGWAGIPNSIRNALTVPGAVIRANSAAMGNIAGRAAQEAVNQSNNNR